MDRSSGLAEERLRGVLAGDGVDECESLSADVVASGASPSPDGFGDEEPCGDARRLMRLHCIAKKKQ